MGWAGDERVSQCGEERVGVEMLERRSGVEAQGLGPRATVVSSAMAPAALLRPSMPSLPALSTTMGARIARAQARANCWLRPTLSRMSA